MFIGFSMESLLDEKIVDIMRDLDECSSDHYNTDHFLVSAAIVETLKSKFDPLVPQQR